MTDFKRKCDDFLNEITDFETTDNGKQYMKLLNEREKFYILTLESANFKITTIYTILRLLCGDLSMTSSHIEKFFIREKLNNIFVNERTCRSIMSYRDTPEGKKLLTLIQRLLRSLQESTSPEYLVFVEYSNDVIGRLEDMYL